MRSRLAQTTGPAFLLDLGDRPARSALTVEDFAGLDLQAGDRLVYRVGWDRHLHEPGYFTDMPRLTVEAARFLAGLRADGHADPES